MVAKVGFPFLTFKRRSLLLALLLGLTVSDSRAQENAYLDPVGTQLGIIDQVVTLAFEPYSMLVLQETAPGVVEQYRAAAVQLDRSRDDDSSGRRFIIGAPVPLSAASRAARRNFTFFLAGRDSSFAATEVKTWDAPTLRENSPTAAEMQQQIQDLHAELKVYRVKALSLEERLNQLRSEASAIANINAIIELKSRIAALQASESEKEEQSRRLQVLIERGRALLDLEEVDALRHELSLHLKEAAKVTAAADRLNRRKNEAAMQSFMQKLNIVKEMERTDAKELAQEVLELRRKRREYENRLGITSSDAGSDQF